VVVHLIYPPACTHSALAVGPVSGTTSDLHPPARVGHGFQSDFIRDVTSDLFLVTDVCDVWAYQHVVAKEAVAHLRIISRVHCPRSTSDRDDKLPKDEHITTTNEASTLAIRIFETG